MYKAEEFEFYRYENTIKTADNKTYNRVNFEKILEIKGSEDHSSLIEMLEDVNDMSSDINGAIKKHFNRENYLTWLAFNIVTGNYDTNTQNFYLYKPTNSNTWYFLPWDYDGSWGFEMQYGDVSKYISPWEHGISNYWGCPLHKRFLKDPENLKDLQKKVQELLKIITKEKTKKLLDSYYKVASGFTKRMPDIYYLPDKANNFDKEYNRIINEPYRYSKIFEQSIQKPMPVYMGDHIKEGNLLKFEWDISYDFQGDKIVYDFALSKTPDFKNIIISKKGLINNMISIPCPTSGVYYWKLSIRDDKGNSQVPFDKYCDEYENYYFGVRKIKF